MIALVCFILMLLSMFVSASAASILVVLPALVFLVKTTIISTPTVVAPPLELVDCKWDGGAYSGCSYNHIKSRKHLDKFGEVR
jgi:hypothetical protein